MLPQRPGAAGSTKQEIASIDSRIQTNVSSVPFGRYLHYGVENSQNTNIGYNAGFPPQVIGGSFFDTQGSNNMRSVISQSGDLYHGQQVQSNIHRSLAQSGEIQNYGSQVTGGISQAGGYPIQNPHYGDQDIPAAVSHSGSFGNAAPQQPISSSNIGNGRRNHLAVDVASAQGYHSNPTRHTSFNGLNTYLNDEYPEYFQTPTSSAFPNIGNDGGLTRGQPGNSTRSNRTGLDQTNAIPQRGDSLAYLGSNGSFMDDLEFDMDAFIKIGQGVHLDDGISIAKKVADRYRL
jgi:hypothetical protein